LVTFRRTDPLYVLDLSKPADPYIISELEIDGFSDYLHPIGDNYLLGIGKDGGVKLSLIDLTDPSHPYEKQKIIIGKTGTDTAVSQTHHAFTSLQQGNNLQVALPVSWYEREDYRWTQDELYRLNINTQTGVMQALAPIVSETASAADPYSYSSYQWPNDRSVMIGEFIHYLHGDKVISQAW